jgi:hypothetical protein
MKAVWEMLTDFSTWSRSMAMPRANFAGPKLVIFHFDRGRFLRVLKPR